MNITLTDTASEIIRNKVGDDKAFLLALNDGPNAFVAHDWCCAKGNQFQIVPVFNQVDGYTTKLSNPEFNVYVSEEEKPYLADHLVMDFDAKMNSFQLKCENNTIDSNIKLKNYFFS
ncbi:iron-sulfur cluster biosynthesis family protein [Enterococcus hulanensis]|uniref:Iron-sulfur cluster biosynthesis family protein n=1 Tax=Enterococcus hulanensis TaxID=2559929 RepID=A0ABU3EV62_9ENTE|nr:MULTISPECIES: iron-sulfur cluster biosynthesis family protein [Enterococcus]MDT2598218.1 iron-sulfur cluster biosynthesis family protein [Enterococcus hulanensis]MDT2608277.1 iron-sulfur cluster biosynthesis family protein [Enterococcus hulanensis]MDT2615572.1 iron-sulfur cluster biosynthesis family protein [Enterococcus hulanensis]MDT2626457.1 iron-sulfur cluster biosynthesis family protein [Enterococcus hulanensis]MDT2654644.1 iron-sulfur cluster biosynthesis family protein [Enterococcus 